MDQHFQIYFETETVWISVTYLKDQKETRLNNHLKGLKVTG